MPKVDMPSIRLNNQAAALLKEVQRKTGPVSSDVEQAILKACTAQAPTSPKLSADQLAQVLVQAMPEQAQVIQTAQVFSKILVVCFWDGEGR